MKFKEIVLQNIKRIPYGKIATYGQIAALSGSPRAARQVGFVLRSLGLNEEEIPWWRVINAQGYISINHGDGGVEKELQRDLLREEGIDVKDDFTMDLQEYLWDGT